MATFSEMKGVKGKVEYLLKRYPRLQDCDNKLIANFYCHEAGGVDLLKTKTAFDFLEDFANSKFTSAESIRRCRQKIQEENPELRGNNYKERQEAGEETRKEVSKL